MALECERYAHRCDLRAAASTLAETDRIGTSEMQGG